MMRLPAALALIGLAVPALAQDLPVFRGTQGYEIEQAWQGGAIVRNGTARFSCQVMRGPEAAVLADCLPILTGPEMDALAQARAVAEAEAAQAAEQRDETQFLRALEALPEFALMPLFMDTLADKGCSFVMTDALEDQLTLEFAQAAAERFDYDGPMTPDFLDGFRRATGHVGLAIVDSGQVTFDDATQVATITDCQDNQD